MKKICNPQTVKKTSNNKQTAHKNLSQFKLYDYIVEFFSIVNKCNKTDFVHSSFFVDHINVM